MTTSLCTVALLAALAGEPEKAQPVPTTTPAAAATPAPAATGALGRSRLDRQIDRAVQENAEEQVPTGSLAASPEPVFEDGMLRQEITVSDWYRDLLLLPDYSSIGKTVKGFGVPRGGQGGSPNWDPVLRKYWWE